MWKYCVPRQPRLAIPILPVHKTLARLLSQDVGGIEPRVKDSEITQVSLSQNGL